MKTKTADPNLPGDLAGRIDRLIRLSGDLEEVRWEIERAKSNRPTGKARLLAFVASNSRREIREVDERLRELSDREKRIQEAEVEARGAIHQFLDEFLRTNDAEYRRLTEQKVATEVSGDHWGSVRNRIREVVSAVGQAKNQMCHAYSKTKQYSPASMESFARLRNALEKLTETLAEFEKRVGGLGVSRKDFHDSGLPDSGEIQKMVQSCGSFSSVDYHGTYKRLESWVDALSPHCEGNDGSPGFLRQADEQADRALRNRRERWITDHLIHQRSSTEGT